MYTELALRVEFKRETPQEIIDILKWMTTPHVEHHSDERPHQHIQHPLFDEGDLGCISGRRLDLEGGITPQLDNESLGEHWTLTIWTQSKWGWKHLLDFIAPHINSIGDESTYIGHYLYEECEVPTLLFAGNGRIRYFAPSDKYGYLESDTIILTETGHI